MKVNPDYSFTRDGLGLQDWLCQLVDESISVRIRAGDALQAMEWGLPSMHTDWNDLTAFPDTAAQSVRFAAALRQVFAEDSFDAPQFLEKLGAFQLALSQDWLNRVSEWSLRMTQRDNKYTRLADQLAEKINSADDEAERKRAEERLAKLSAVYIAGSCNDTSEDSFAQAESTAASGIAAGRIFQILDVELLSAPVVLERLLADSQLRYEALSVLHRCGPAAVSFAENLIQDLDRLSRSRKTSSWFDAAQALGSIGQNDPVIVAQMIERLTHPTWAVRKAAANVLQHMEGQVCQRNTEICELLLPWLEQEECWCDALLALASVGRDLPDIRGKVIALAKPREPQWRTYEGFGDMQYNQTMHQRGLALSAFESFTAYPDECLPVLIEALETFEEFDPDEGYQGPQGRLAGLIARFGPAAGPAVLPLAQHLDDEPEEIPSAILEALASLGPTAGAALPALHNLHQKYPPDELVDLSITPVDRDDDPIGWTIQQILGKPVQGESE